MGPKNASIGCSVSTAAVSALSELFCFNKLELDFLVGGWIDAPAAKTEESTTMTLPLACKNLVVTVDGRVDALSVRQATSQTRACRRATV